MALEKTKVTNMAEIYFDYNPPIYTNSTLNIFVSKLIQKITQKSFLLIIILKLKKTM